MVLVPGSNLFITASSVIGLSTVQYYSYVSRSSNNAGFLVATFATPVAVQGSVQPIPRHKYEALGLDLQKDYFYLYTKSTVIDLERDVAGDQFTFNGHTYQCQSKTAWDGIDFWCSVIAVRIQ